MTQSQSIKPENKLYAVYPDYWLKKWGDKPLLGYVKATDPFYAKRKAYDAKLLTVNFTFGPDVIEVKKFKPKPPTGQ